VRKWNQQELNGIYECGSLLVSMRVWWIHR